MSENKEKRLGFEIKKVSNLIKTRFGEIVQSTYDSKDFPENYSWILGYLFRHRDRVVCQKDLEKAFCVGRATMSKMLTCLEDKGYIERKNVDTDKRLNQIVLTEKGLKLESKIKESIDNFDNKLLATLSDEEREQMFALLEKLAFALQNTSTNE